MPWELVRYSCIFFSFSRGWTRYSCVGKNVAQFSRRLCVLQDYKAPLNFHRYSLIIVIEKILRHLDKIYFTGKSVCFNENLNDIISYQSQKMGFCVKNGYGWLGNRLIINNCYLVTEYVFRLTILCLLKSDQYEIGRVSLICCISRQECPNAMGQIAY